jgi:hypothetical protein
MKEIMEKLKEANSAIVEGSSRIGWIVPLFTGTSLLSYALSTISLNFAYASLTIPILTVSSYYLIGKAHRKEMAK